MGADIIALILFATLIGSGVYMRIKDAIDHGPLDDGEVGDGPRVPPELLAVNHCDVGITDERA